MEKKIIWKFNIIDLIIIALVLLSIIALVYRMAAGGGEDEREYTMTFVCEEAPTSLLYGIDSGEACLDSESGTELGYTTSVSVQPSEETPSLASATITATTEAFKSDHGITVSDTVYLKGSRINLIIGDAIFDVYIEDIK